MFLERFLDVFQNRFSIGFRYFGPFATQISRLRAAMPALRWKRGFEFSFDTVPISVTHRRPLCNISRCAGRIRQSGCINEKTGISG
jgi:hypothetical protein